MVTAETADLLLSLAITENQADIFEFEWM